VDKDLLFYPRRKGSLGPELDHFWNKGAPPLPLLTHLAQMLWGKERRVYELEGPYHAVDLLQPRLESVTLDHLRLEVR
jgi:hypothetical protein